MTLPVPFDPQGFPIVNAITWDGGAVGPGVPIELPPEDITQVTTDAGSFAGNFPGASLYRAINGGLTLTTGSTAWARANTVTPLRVGDYVEIVADHNDAAPVMAQIATINNDGLGGTLQAAYAGAGGALAAAQVSDWYVQIIGAGAGIAVGGGAATLNPALANPARCTLARYMGPGGRKGCAPLWARFILRQDVRRVNQMTSFGLGSNIATALGIVQSASFNLSGVMLDTQVVLVGARDVPNGIVDLDGDVVPGGGSTADAQGHLFEVLLLEDQVKWYIDRTLVGTEIPGDYAGQGEIPDPYAGMWLFLQIENTGVPGGATNLVVRDVHCKSLDVVDVRCVQPDGDKLHVTVDSMMPVNVDLQGQVESLPAPNPASVRGALADLALLEEPDHALRTRARVLTTEGEFADDWSVAGGGGTGTGIDRALTGNSQFTLGSTAVVGVGTAYTTEVREGDYVQLDADNNWAVPVWAQVASVNSDTSLTLTANYAGAGGAAGASSVSNWSIGTDGAAMGPVVAGSAVSLDPGLGAGDTQVLLRRVSIPNRKDYSPLRFESYSRVIAVGGPLAISTWGFYDGAAFGAVNVQAMFQVWGNNDVHSITLNTTDNVADAEMEQVYLQGGGSVLDYHWYRIEVWPDRVDYYIDQRRVGRHRLHQPLPWTALYAVLARVNAGGIAGAMVLQTDRCSVSSHDVVDVAGRIDQGEPTVAADAWPVAVSAAQRSLPAPNPAGIVGARAEGRLEPDGALVTRSRALTDEGSFAANFPGASLYRALTGGANITFTNGSTQVRGVGSLFTSEVRVGDYVEITAQDNPAAPVWVQVNSIESDTALTLRTAWAGVTATGAAQVCDWYVLITGAAASIGVAAFAATLTAGTANGGRALLARRLGAGGRKGCAPLLARFTLRQNQRLANVTTSFGFANTLGAIAGCDEIAIFGFPGGGTGPDVEGIVSHDGVAGANTDAMLIPGGGSTADAKQHVYEVRLHEDQVVWHIDGIDTRSGMPMEYAGELAIPDPYSEMYLFIQIENTAVVAAGTNLIVIDAHCKSLDVVDVRPVQPDPDKHHVAAHDQTIMSGSYAPPAPHNIADNLAHPITTGNHLEKGHGYLFLQSGGDLISLMVVAPGAGAPAVATIRQSPIRLQSGVPWKLVPRNTGEQVYCCKSVDGTANADVYHDTTDSGNGA